MTLYSSLPALPRAQPGLGQVMRVYTLVSGLPTYGVPQDGSRPSRMP